MTAPTSSAVFRSLAALLLVVCFGLAALPGCSGPAPKAEKKDDKKDEKKDTNPDGTGGPKPDGKPEVKPDVPPKNTLGPVEPAADQAATAFLRDLVHGTAKPEALSSAFLRAVGKPWAFPGDKEKGYSPNSAESWLKQVGAGNTFGLALKQEQVGDVVYIRGALQKPGGYCLRLVKEGGAWKVDWLSVSSVESGTLTTTPTPEGTAQGFAVAAFVETITDVDGTPKENRHLLIAAATTKELRTAWSPLDFDQDRLAGYDYGPGKLVPAAVKIGGGTKAYAASRVGDLPEFKVELTKPEGKKTFVVKLVKGAAPHEWLVSEVSEAKG